MVVRNVGVTAEFASENQFKELIQWTKVKVARNFIVKANAALTGYKAALADRRIASITAMVIETPAIVVSKFVATRDRIPEVQVHKPKPRL